jgi:tetratricopeptide (TPR) repeat protein
MAKPGSVHVAMNFDSHERLSLAKHLEQSAEQKLKASDCFGATVDARQAQALASWREPVDPSRRTLSPAEREISVSASTIQALALAYGDRKTRGASVASVARELAKSTEIHPKFELRAELVALHIAEMRRELDSTMQRLWELGTQLQADSWSQADALRAYARLIACAIWSEDLEAASRAKREGDRLLKHVDEPDVLGSYLIWPAQMLMRLDKFEQASDLLHQALDLREATPRRTMTDLYASAYFELKRGDHDVGMSLFEEFITGTVEAKLYQYARVGLETLSPMF